MTEFNSRSWLPEELAFELMNDGKALALCRERLGLFLQQRCGELERNRILLAVEEALVNTFEHGYGSETGMVEVRAGWLSDELKIELSDRAPIYDPTSVPLRNPESSGEDGAEGGYGLFLLRTLMRVEHHPRQGGGNVLILYHRFRVPGSEQRDHGGSV